MINLRNPVNFIRINFEVILGRKINHQEVRHRNISHIFSRVIYSMQIVEDEYDCTYKKIKESTPQEKHNDFSIEYENHEKAKISTLDKLLDLEKLLTN